MLITAPFVDLNWFIQFVFTAFVVVVGLLYLVKNTASKYFVVDDANFEGGGVGSNGDSVVLNRSSERDRRTRMPGFPNAVPADVCVVCGGDGSKQCSGCKVVRYCSGKCQSAHWHSGHKKTCKTIRREDKVSRTLIKKTLFPYDEFIRYFNWNNPGFPPCGLLNCGNSCFANVVLQCLSHTRPLVAYLLEKGHQQECRLNNWCFLCEFQTHVERGRKSLHSFSPMNILSRLPNIGGNLGHGKQEDAHEFMRFAIDTMQAVCLEEFGGEKAVHPSSQETTLIQHIFGGHLQSQVICTNCNKISNQYESMMDLTVEIHGDAASLEECLDQFTVKEWLHGDNMYKCDGCDDYVKAWKRLTVRQAPNILTIALKRFQSGRFGKLNKRVTFPETLDLSPYMTEAVTGADVYKLYAVVVHLDMLNASYFGHYICYIKDFSGNWYMIDDCKVVKVDLEDVLSEGAYMLLYSRVDARPSCLEPIETLRKEERLNVNVTPEIAPSNPSPGDITASADPHVLDSPLEYSLDTKDVELECIGPKPLVSEEIETHSHANEDTLLPESEECHPKSGLDIDMLEEDINNGNNEEEVVPQNLPEHPLLTENGAHDNGRTADELLPNEGLQRSSCNGGLIEKFPNGNSSTQATLKPIFSSGFLDKHPKNKSMMSNGNSSQESRPKLSLSHEVEKNCNGSLNQKHIEINDQPNPHLSSNGFSLSASVHEQLQKCLNKVNTIEINSDESVKNCKGDVTSPNATIPTESIIPNDTESIITNDVKEKNKFCAQNQFNHSSIQQQC